MFRYFTIRNFTISKYRSFYIWSFQILIPSRHGAFRTTSRRFDYTSSFAPTRAQCRVDKLRTSSHIIVRRLCTTYTNSLTRYQEMID